MSQLRFWGLIPAFCLLALPLGAQSSNELKLGNGGLGKYGSVRNVPLTLTTTDQVQGLVAAFDWNAANGLGVDLVVGPALSNADTVVRRVEASYMVLGVVMDSDGINGEVISPGTDLLLATAQIECLEVEAVTPIEFKNDLYATVDGGPLLEEHRGGRRSVGRAGGRAGSDERRHGVRRVAGSVLHR